MTWWQNLRPASFRGVPFGVLSADAVFGRRQAIHEYPYRDTVWVEDLGRAARRIRLIGFLVENSLVYGGGDVVAQRERLIAACETEGEGELVHPTLGRLTVSLLELGVTERREHGRVFEIGFSFLEAGARVFPSVVVSTGDDVARAADAADSAAAGDFAARLAEPLKQGAAVVRQAATTAGIWARRVQGLANDATNLYNMVGALPGTFGRYFGGKRRRSLGDATSGVAATARNVNDLVGIGTRARADVGTAADTVGTIAGKLGL